MVATKKKAKKKQKTKKANPNATFALGKRWEGKLSKTDTRVFNAMADERLMAIAAELKTGFEALIKGRKVKIKINWASAQEHVRACIFNGLIDAYKAGRKDAIEKRRTTKWV